MAVEPQGLYTYADLQANPEDNLRRGIIDGEQTIEAASLPGLSLSVDEILGPPVEES